MDFVELTCVCALLLRFRQKKRKRRYWVHPVISARLLKGQFYKTYQDLRLHPQKFFKYTRMSIKSFDKLHELISPHITYQNVVRDCIPSVERLLVTLRYLATGNSFQSLHLEYLLGATTVREIVRDTCDKLWICLQPTYMKEKTTKDWLKIAEDFYKQTGFPNCTGAISGKHIRLKIPNNTGSVRSSYDQYPSVVLIAAVDSNYCFSAVDIGAYGCDSQIFKNSNFARLLKQNLLNIPEKRHLPSDTSGTPMPFVFVGNEAFCLSEHVLRPYSKRNLTNLRQIFNIRLSRAHRIIEGAFGILANKWRIFHRPLNTNPEFCDSIIKACCVLHNFIRQHDHRQAQNNEDSNLTNPFINIALSNQRSSYSAQDSRTYFAEYFTSPQGSVAWQYDCI